MTCGGDSHFPHIARRATIFSARLFAKLAAGSVHRGAQVKPIIEAETTPDFCSVPAGKSCTLRPHQRGEGTQPQWTKRGMLHPTKRLNAVGVAHEGSVHSFKHAACFLLRTHTNQLDSVVELQHAHFFARYQSQRLANGLRNNNLKFRGNGDGIHIGF